MAVSLGSYFKKHNIVIVPIPDYNYRGQHSFRRSSEFIADCVVGKVAVSQSLRNFLKIRKDGKNSNYYKAIPWSWYS